MMRGVIAIDHFYQAKYVHPRYSPADFRNDVALVRFIFDYTIIIGNIFIKIIFSTSDSLEMWFSRSTSSLSVFLDSGKQTSSFCVIVSIRIIIQEHISIVIIINIIITMITRQHFVGQYAYVVGWGRTQHGVAATPSLLQVPNCRPQNHDDHISSSTKSSLYSLSS